MFHASVAHWLFEEEERFDSIVDLTVGAVLHLAADARRAVQRETFSWGTQYSEWLFSTELWNIEDTSQNMPVIAMMALTLPVAYLPFMFVSAAPYLNPYTIAPAFAIDAYNIYRYFD